MTMQIWEYLRVNNPSDDELKQLGEQGWELVAVASETFSPALAGFGRGVGTAVTYIFKRPKP